jgi:hypothetical protein
MFFMKIIRTNTVLLDIKYRILGFHVLLIELNIDLFKNKKIGYLEV